MIQYKIEKRQDLYFLINEGVNNIDYEVKLLSNCTNYLVVYTGQVGVGTEVQLILDVDGDYQIQLDDTINPTFNVPIKYYLNLQLALIQSVYNIIGKCECKNCSESTLCTTLMGRARIDSYKRLTNPEGVAFFDGIYKYTNCLVKQPIYCSISEEIIRGDSKCNEELINQFIALDYLAIYFFEFFQQDTDEDKDYVRTKFKTEKIFCCIQKLGINIGDIETLIDNNMGTFTINSAAYINQPPSSVGNNTLGVLNRATTILTLANFTTETTPVYIDPEGDPVADVRIDTLPVDGVLRLNGVLVITGQIIAVADINNSLLTYESPNQDAIDTDTFDFSLRDSGSGQFSS